jgi:hypothetical protein
MYVLELLNRLHLYIFHGEGTTFRLLVGVRLMTGRVLVLLLQGFFRNIRYPRRRAYGRHLNNEIYSKC